VKIVINFITLAIGLLKGTAGELSKLWEDDTGNNEYIYDCSDYQLAVKVG